MSNDLKAFCTSRRCAQVRYENLSNYAVKDVKETKDYRSNLFKINMQKYKEVLG